MQSVLQLPDAPTPLAEPLDFSVLLFEQPWIFMAVSLLAGLIASVWMKRKGQPGKGIVLLLCGAMLAGGFFSLAKIVVTERERVAWRMRELLQATASADTPALAALLDPAARMNYFKAPGGLDKAGILEAVNADLGHTYRLKDWSIQELQIAPTSANSTGAMSTQMRVRVTPEAWNFPHTSWWSVDWKKDGTTWRVIRIRPLSIQFFQGNPGGN